MHVYPSSFKALCATSLINFFAFQGGIYFFQIIDKYSSGISLMLIALFEVIAITWCYGKLILISVTWCYGKLTLIAVTWCYGKLTLISVTWCYGKLTLIAIT